MLCCAGEGGGGPETGTPGAVAGGRSGRGPIVWLASAAFDFSGCTHRLLSSSFWGLPHRNLNIDHKKELLRSLWVVQQLVQARSGLKRQAAEAAAGEV